MNLCLGYEDKRHLNNTSVLQKGSCVLALDSKSICGCFVFLRVTHSSGVRNVTVVSRTSSIETANVARSTVIARHNHRDEIYTSKQTTTLLLDSSKQRRFWIHV